MRRFIAATVVFIYVLSYSFINISPAYDSPKENIIRIAVFKDADNITLTIRGSYLISTPDTNQSLMEGRHLHKVNLTPTESGIMLGETPLKIYAVRIEPKEDTSVYINNRRFRGAVKIIRTKQKKLIVVNEVDVENYLRGVLFHEVSHRWPIEAIKAQAIVSRTFALYQAQENKGLDYDMTADIYSQMYGGAYSEKYRTDKAIAQTKGIVLMYRGRFLPAYFHATCGGKTEDASQLWKTDERPLKGVDCNFCARSKHFNWTANIPIIEVQEKLKAKGFGVGDIKDIGIAKRNNSNRITRIDIKSDLNDVSLSGKEFRQMIGSNLIRSTNFDVTIKDSIAEFTGLGWGHGAGMCQWGAYFMAKKGYKAKDILEFYYPGAEVVKLK